MILMGMAVTAVSGCVAVEPRPAPGPAPRPGTSNGTPGPGAVEPLIIEAPAREALEAVVPPPTPKAAPRSSAEAGRTAQDRTSGSERPPAASLPEQRTHERPKEQRHSVSSSAPTMADVCALGESYGQWPKDSPQALICRDTHGD